MQRYLWKINNNQNNKIKRDTRNKKKHEKKKTTKFQIKELCLGAESTLAYQVQRDSPASKWSTLANCAHLPKPVSFLGHLQNHRIQPYLFIMKETSRQREPGMDRASAALGSPALWTANLKQLLCGMLRNNERAQEVKDSTRTREGQRRSTLLLHHVFAQLVPEAKKPNLPADLKTCKILEQMNLCRKILTMKVLCLGGMSTAHKLQ